MELQRGEKIVDLNLRRTPAAKEAHAFWIMHIVGSKLLLSTVILAAVFATGCRAQDISQRDLHSKIAYCETCHGPSAQGFVGYYPIPRLAGQEVAYLENQLKGFMERKRSNPIMFNVAHVLSPAMVTALATYFHDLNPKPASDGPKQLVASGKAFYEKGVPDANVPPCASCHGPEAKGNGQIPRLAGQLHPYVVKQLTNWSKERGEETSGIMEPIAHSMTKPQVEAVAAYLSYLE